MKSVVQIQRQGKVKVVKASAAAAGVLTEETETKLVLIQALIPLGLQAVGEALDVEVLPWLAPPYSRAGGHGGVVRWGSNKARST